MAQQKTAKTAGKKATPKANKSVLEDTMLETNDTVTEIEMDEEVVSSFDDTTEEKSNSTKTILMILVGIVAVIAIVFAVVKVGIFDKDKTSNFEQIIISATKEYYTTRNSDLPTAYGKCNVVTLNTLLDNSLVSKENNDILSEKKFDGEKTTVKVCMLENGNYHYTATLSSDDKKLTASYGEWKEGKESDLTADKSDVKFSFLLQEAEVPLDLEKIPDETFWEDEITYSAGTYTTVGTQTYYRSREKTYRWYTETDYYYPGNETNKYKANQYFVTSPDKTYDKKGDTAKVWRWYVNGNTVYNNGEYLSEQPDTLFSVKGTENPNKLVSAYIAKPVEKDYRTITTETIYRVRKLSSTEVVSKTEYKCVTTLDKNSPAYTSQILEEPCTSAAATEIGTTIIEKIRCTWTNDKTGKKTESGWADDTCKPKFNYVNEQIGLGYGNWLSEDQAKTAGCTFPFETQVDTKPYLCDRTSGFVASDRSWKWYTPATKTYYPSNDKVVYYKESPSTQAIKDSSTETTASTWYKTVKKDLGYSKTAPVATAKQVVGDESWSAWSDYTLTKIAATNTRQVEERKKLTIKKTVNDSTKWNNLTDGYVTEAEVIEKAKAAGYAVEVLEDILQIPNVQYSIKMYYRDQK